jgi:hypothetical protein
MIAAHLEGKETEKGRGRIRASRGNCASPCETVRTEMDLTANKSQNDFKMSKVKNKCRCMEWINSFLTMRCMSKRGLSF